MNGSTRYTTLALKPPSTDADEACQYLESIINEYAGRGWEFIRVETVWLNMAVPPKPFSAAIFKREETAGQP